LIINKNSPPIDLRGQNLRETTVKNCDIRGTYFDYSKLNLSSFIKAQLYDVSFVGAILETAYFMECDLTNCKFDFANLTRAIFSKCYGTNVSFIGANLRSVIIRSSNFPLAKFDNMKAKDGTFKYSDLCHSTFYGAQLDDAYFESSDLRRTIFRFSKHNGITVNNCQWEGSSYAEPIRQRKGKKVSHGAGAKPV
jgi:uncharacterized protein YjbI with pentapeptide repeats